jgi:hypothetical protein
MPAAVAMSYGSVLGWVPVAPAAVLKKPLQVPVCHVEHVCYDGSCSEAN